VSIVWWLSPLLVGVLVLGWFGVSVYGKLNSMSETLQQAVTLQADSVATQRAMVGSAPSLLRSTPVPADGCSATKKSCTYQDMTLCFLQLGAESDWRTANTASMKETAQQLGAKLIFADAQARQENQISAMRACIQQGVSVIALAPMVEDGWEAVLTEARNAGIPVILVDRSVSADPSLYAVQIGSSGELEGERAAAEFNKLLPNGGAILEVAGTTGSSEAIKRARGFRKVLNANIQILDSQTGNFMRTDAFPTMQAFLNAYRVGTDFQGIFFQNDDMGIGGIEALKEAGVKPGTLKIISIDATHEGFQAMVDGWFQADVECSPLMGPQVFELALKLMNGEPVNREVLTNETVYYPDNAAELLPTRLY
jgi:simple sugar transport system substrate-binding protein